MKTMTRRTFANGIALLPSLRFSAANAQTGTTPAEARAIAREAYVYGFPLVDSYRIQYDYFVDSKGPEFKAPWNHIANTPRVYTPADTAIQTPNADTPYSWLGLDLRSEPIVLGVPEIEKNRYSASNSPTPTPSTSIMSEPALQETMQLISLSWDRIGKVLRRAALRR